VFHLGAIAGVGTAAPLVTLTAEDYSALMATVNDSARYVCEASWLFNYYEGKSSDPSQKECPKHQPAPVLTK
jgi:hypothetical protein